MHELHCRTQCIGGGMRNYTQCSIRQSRGEAADLARASHRPLGNCADCTGGNMYWGYARLRQILMTPPRLMANDGRQSKGFLGGRGAARLMHCQLSDIDERVLLGRYRSRTDCLRGLWNI